MENDSFDLPVPIWTVETTLVDLVIVYLNIIVHMLVISFISFDGS